MGREGRIAIAPPGYTQLSGSCIGGGDSGDDLCRESVQVLRDEQSGLRLILVTRELRGLDGRPFGGNPPLGLVSDALEPEVLDDAAMQVAVGTCRVGGRGDGRVVAILHPREVEWLRAGQAWRVDRDGKLQAIAAADVECLNEGFGYDG